MGTKAWLKRALQRGIAAGTHSRWWRPQKGLAVLMYHRVLPRDDPRLLDEQPGMVVHPETLRMHVQSLRDHYEIVSLGDWVSRVDTGQPVPERACAITFDDGWRDNHEHAWPILQEARCPATIFLVSAMVGTVAQFWPERLARVLRLAAAEPASLWRTPEFAWLEQLGLPAEICAELPDPERLDRIISAVKRYPERIIYTHLQAMEARLASDRYHPEAPALLDWGQVREMAASGLVEMGSHTRSHARLLPSLTEEEVHDEVVQSKADIEARTGLAPKLFCFPNGTRSKLACTAVASHYRAACLTDRGWNAPAADPFALKRIAVHEDIAYDRAAFLARVSGWV